MPVDTILYDILGVQSNVNDNELKKAYRKLSMKYHPDRNPDNKDEATKKFQEISEAYSILSDNEKRKIYDQVGIDMLKHGGEGPGFDPSDIFNQFMSGMGGMGGFPFGGAKPFGGKQQQSEEEHCILEKIVSLEDIYNQNTINVNYNIKVYCDTCNGFGTKSKKDSTCQQCNGNGKQVKVIKQGPMIQQIVMPCQKCNGSGNFINNNDKCNTCNGSKFNIKNKNINIPLKQGLVNGNKVQLSKKGHVYKTKKTDLIIVIRIQDHPVFERDGNNIHTKIEIPLYQDLFGFTQKIKHLDNRYLYFRTKEQNNFSNVKVIKGEGFTDLQGNKGDMYIHINTKNPDMSILDDNEKQELKNILLQMNLSDYQDEGKCIKDGKDNIKNLQNVVRQQRQEHYQQTQQDGPPECVQQ